MEFPSSQLESIGEAAEPGAQTRFSGCCSIPLMGGKCGEPGKALWHRPQTVLSLEARCDRKRHDHGLGGKSVSNGRDKCAGQPGLQNLPNVFCRDASVPRWAKTS